LTITGTILLTHPTLHIPTQNNDHFKIYNVSFLVDVTGISRGKALCEAIKQANINDEIMMIVIILLLFT
jgi:hypothetical protein